MKYNLYKMEINRPVEQYFSDDEFMRIRPTGEMTITLELHNSKKFNKKANENVIQEND